MQQSRVPVRFCCLEVWKNATVSCSRLVLLSRSVKMQQSRVPAWFCRVEVWKNATVLCSRLVLLSKCEKMQECHVRARFCCLEVWKNATVSCSRLFLLSESVKKCNLVSPLVFAFWGCQKMQHCRVPVLFCCLKNFPAGPYCGLDFFWLLGSKKTLLPKIKF